jgi:predicted nucleotidyltransferase
MNTRIVNKLRAFFPAYPVEKVWLFGSYARGEETRKSDVDIMVKFTENSHISLFDHIRIMNKLQDLLKRKVDLVEEGCIMKFAQQSVEQDKKLIYERAN